MVGVKIAPAFGAKNATSFQRNYALEIQQLAPICI